MVLVKGICLIIYQDVLSLMTTSFILMTGIFDHVVITVKRKLISCCPSALGLKWLIKVCNTHREAMWPRHQSSHQDKEIQDHVLLKTPGQLHGWAFWSVSCIDFAIFKCLPPFNSRFCFNYRMYLPNMNVCIL